MAIQDEVITLSRFFDLAGNKRSFVTEDIIDYAVGSLADFIQKTKKTLQEFWESASKSGSIAIAGNISERDNLGNEAGVLVWVEDATADDTVNKGGAAYLSVEREGEIEWEKLTESESMDISLTWEELTGKPTSAPSEIDDAVGKKHAHDNDIILENISDKNGFLSFGGILLNGYTGIDQREDFSQKGDFKSKIRMSVETIILEGEEDEDLLLSE